MLSTVSRPLLLALFATLLHTVTPHPSALAHVHQHSPRQNWADPNLYKDVDWSGVNYGKPAPSPPESKPAAVNAPPSARKSQPAPAPEKPHAAAPAPSVDEAPKPKTNGAPVETEQKNSAASSAGYGGPKRGLAFNDQSPSLNIFAGNGGLSGGWCFNWFSKSSQDLPGGVSYVPLLWGVLPVHTEVWRANADAAIKANGRKGTWLMAFNEPDIPSQANMGVGQAIGAWGQYMQPYAGREGVHLGAPAVSNAVGPAKGLDWLKQFLSGCNGCQIDFVPVHWYGCDNGCDVANEVQAFKDFVGQATQSADGRKIWITEFETKSDAPTFMREILPWLDSNSAVERYAYFLVGEGSLVQGGQVSALGKVYGAV